MTLVLWLPTAWSQEQSHCCHLRQCLPHLCLVLANSGEPFDTPRSKQFQPVLSYPFFVSLIPDVKCPHCTLSPFLCVLSNRIRQNRLFPSLKAFKTIFMPRWSPLLTQTAPILSTFPERSQLSLILPLDSLQVHLLLLEMWPPQTQHGAAGVPQTHTKIPRCVTCVWEQNFTLL